MLSNIRHFQPTAVLTESFVKKSLRTFSTTTVAPCKEQLSTLDLREVRLHEKLARVWWNVEGPMKALHSYNEIRLPFVRDGLLNPNEFHFNMHPLKQRRILDVGCGGGILAIPLARLGAKVIGIDGSDNLVRLAHSVAVKDTRMTEYKPEFYCSTIEEHVKLHSNSYDGVVASEVIEHVDNKELFVQKLIDAAKPGGKIFITTPNRTKLAELGVIWFAENVLGTVPKGTHNIDKFITPQELTFLIERNGALVEMTHGVMYNVFTNRWSWSPYYAFAYALRAIKI